MSIEALVLRIKRRESWWARCLYDLALLGRRIHVPYIPLLHGPMYYERRLRIRAWRHLKRIFYYEPMMRARCVQVGRNFSLVQAMPLISGNLRIFIGDNVTIDGTNTFGANRVYDEPVLIIGDNTFIGWHVTISVAKEVTIGKNCLFGINTMIADNDMHPVNWRLRRQGAIVDKADVKPVHIGNDVWVGAGCFILKGVRIGDGAVIGAGSVVVKDIPPYSIAAGSPARVVKKLSESQMQDTKDA